MHLVFFASFSLVIFATLPYAVRSHLNSLTYYEQVEPVHIGEHVRNKRDLSTRSRDSIQHLEETRFIVDGHKRHFSIKLQKNNILLPPSFTAIHHDENGQIIKNLTQPENCFYHGELEGKEDTFVVLSTCNGLRGLIHDDDGEEFYIEPENESKSHIMYNMNDLKISRNISCGNNDVIDRTDDLGTMKEHLKRHRRNVLNARKYIQVVAVVGTSKVNSWGGSSKAKEKVMEMMNYVDIIYKTVNTRIALVNVVLDPKGVEIQKSASATLSSFEKYTKDTLFGSMDLTADNAQLIVDDSFNDDIVGLASVGSICTLRSCAVNHDHSNNLATSASTIAHELGHNLGLNHYGSSCKCSNEKCVMSSYLDSNPTVTFTDCSTSTYYEINNNGGYGCLFDYPNKLYGPQKCGNGYKEPGEECDCGTEQECKSSGADKCCTSTTCKLRNSAQCADGMCCEDCKFKAQGTLCRSNFNSKCDLDEFCNGASSECPDNFYVNDGTDCNNGTGYCYLGQCKSHSEQCEVLWGSVGTRAVDNCYRANMKGNEYGNCGQDDGNFVQCSEADMFCGKIQCKEKPGETLPGLPLIGSSREKRGKTITTASGASYSCVIAKMSFGKEESDPTLVYDGVKCANNSICLDKKCTQLSTLKSAKSCSGKCKNGGICNSNGNCHCSRGFACPYCEFPGIGGSQDSGQGCSTQEDCSCLTPLVKALLVVFLLVLPIIGLIIFCCCRHKEKIRAVRLRFENNKGITAVSKGNNVNNKTKMKTGDASKTVIHNPYSTQPSTVQHTVIQQKSHTNVVKTEKTLPKSNQKSVTPSKLPPISTGAQPGKLHQIDAYNRKDAEARMPQVHVKQPRR